MPSRRRLPINIEVKLKTLVLFHANCLDGFTAATVAFKEFNNTADYIPCSYGKSVKQILSHSNAIYDQCYILDFSLPMDELYKLKEYVDGKIYLIDHHKTALEIVTKNLTPSWLDFTLNMKKSGAQLAWDHFFPGQDEPDIVKYVGDRDLWKFEYSETKPFCAALKTKPKQFQFYEPILRDRERHFTQMLVEQGNNILDYQSAVIDNACNYGHKFYLQGYLAVAVNATNLNSEIANELLERFPDCAIAMVYGVTSTHVNVSLRSRKNEDVDVSSIAKRYGGGGHPNASGFRVESTFFSSFILGLG